MSGGLDSTSVAAVAARELRSTGDDDVLPVISWIFEQTPAADERPYIAAMIDTHRFQSVKIRADDGWPLSEPSTWPWNPNSPLEGLYRRLQERAYRAAGQNAASVLLSGDGADALWTREAYWLSSLLSHGRLGSALLETGRHLRLSDTRPHVSLKGAAARAVGLRGRRSVTKPDWLTVEGSELWSEGRTSGTTTTSGAEAQRSMLDASLSQADGLESGPASRAGIEVRRPFRDRRVVEFFLALPEHQIYRPGWRKYLLRKAMQGVLPDLVRLRRWGSTLMPLAVRGLVERESGAVTDLLGDPSALWRRYVLPERVVEAYKSHLGSLRDGINAVIPWRCICAEVWRRGWAITERPIGAQGRDNDRKHVIMKQEAFDAAD
jgi:asparagine synthase (glutamine-hydrolysing)